LPQNKDLSEFDKSAQEVMREIDQKGRENVESVMKEIDEDFKKDPNSQ
jgi:hypothetical protein